MPPLSEWEIRGGKFGANSVHAKINSSLHNVSGNVVRQRQHDRYNMPLMGPDGIGTARWKLRATLVAVLVVLSALALLENYQWGSTYSAIVGLPARIQEAEFSRHRAQLFALISAVLEIVAIAIMMPLIRLRSTGKAVVIARAGIALGIALIGTGLVCWLLVLVAVKFRLA